MAKTPRDPASSDRQTDPPPDWRIVPVEYSPGQWVSTDGGPDVMVVSVVYSNGGVSYGCEWWDGKSRNSATLHGFQITGVCGLPPDRPVTGFVLPPDDRPT